MIKKLRTWLDDWATRRFLALLNETDPLTVRRLRFALEEGITLDGAVDREDERIEQVVSERIQRLVIERTNNKPAQD